MMKDNKPTGIKEVAQEAGVSISTVSRVLHCATNVDPLIKERVLEAVEKTGYIANPIASTLKSTRTGQIGVIIPTLNDSFQTLFIRGVLNFCSNVGIIPNIVVACGGWEEERKVIKGLQNKWIDGIILIPSSAEDNCEYEEYHNSLKNIYKKDTLIPVVLAGNTFIDDMDRVMINYEETGYNMAKHMIADAGRKHIACFSLMDHSPLCSSWLGGIKKAHDEAGIELDLNMIKTGNCLSLSGYDSMMELLDEGKETDAIICNHDHVAAGALLACKERGIRVPEDIAISGIYGTPFSAISDPPITTQVVNGVEYGYKTAELLYRRINQQMYPDMSPVMHVELDTRLEIRESTIPGAKKTLPELMEIQSTGF